MNVIELSKRLPRVHLIAAGTGALALGVALLMPSQEVAANKSQVTLELKAPEGSAPQLPLQPSPASTGETVPAAAGSFASLTPALPEDSVVTPEAHTPVTATVEATPEPAKEEWLRIEVRAGDNLTTLFKKAGLGANELYPMLNSIESPKALGRLKPGEFLDFVIEEGELRKLRHEKSPLVSTLVTKEDGKYRLEEVERQPEARAIYRSGTIESSLFLAGEEAGLSQGKIMELATLFGWDVDFALDIRKGDSFALIYEELFLDGKKIGDGEILAAEFTNQGKRFRTIRYTDSNGRSDYYTPEGDSMRKAFLRTPVDFARVSSRFNPNRLHPIHGTRRPHRGVDYAAATGTPIKSAGDGKVIHAGRKGGYGKTVVIQHGQAYSTLYAHMSRIKPGLRRGSRVRQGQLIGYVGSTGNSTGPHLHYEFRVNGVHRNPLTVDLPKAAPLPKKERANFEPLARDLLAQLETQAQTQLASQ
ncbi:OapA family protein [Motiliproteus sp. SC1-56]|uniref:OapA family protein n=1 Tax=Motiliproteus sp. SC1-56 TaxID=2799565 RepID=UPI00351C51BF